MNIIVKFSISKLPKYCFVHSPDLSFKDQAIGHLQKPAPCTRLKENSITDTLDTRSIPRYAQTKLNYTNIHSSYSKISTFLHFYYVEWVALAVQSCI